MFKRRSVARQIVPHDNDPLDLDPGRFKMPGSLEQAGHNPRVLELDLTWRDGRDCNIGQTRIARTKAPVRDQIAKQVADGS